MQILCHFLLRTWAVDFCIHRVLETTAHGYQETSTFPFYKYHCAFSLYQTVVKAGSILLLIKVRQKSWAFSLSETQYPLWEQKGMLPTSSAQTRPAVVLLRTITSCKCQFEILFTSNRRFLSSPHHLCYHSFTACHRIPQIAEPMNGRH